MRTGCPRATHPDRRQTVMASAEVLVEPKAAQTRSGRGRAGVMARIFGREKAGARTYRWSLGQGSDGQWRHGDRAISGVMAWCATRTDGQPPAGETIDHDALAFKSVAQAESNAKSLFKRVIKGMFR